MLLCTLKFHGPQNAGDFRPHPVIFVRKLRYFRIVLHVRGTRGNKGRSFLLHHHARAVHIPKFRRIKVGRAFRGNQEEHQTAIVLLGSLLIKGQARPVVFDHARILPLFREGQPHAPAVYRLVHEDPVRGACSDYLHRLHFPVPILEEPRPGPIVLELLEFADLALDRLQRYLPGRFQVRRRAAFRRRAQKHSPHRQGNRKQNAEERREHGIKIGHPDNQPNHGRQERRQSNQADDAEHPGQYAELDQQRLHTQSLPYPPQTPGGANAAAGFPIFLSYKYDIVLSPECQGLSFPGPPKGKGAPPGELREARLYSIHADLRLCSGFLNRRLGGNNLVIATIGKPSIVPNHNFFPGFLLVYHSSLYLSIFFRLFL